MNEITRQIADRFGIDLATAAKVQHYIDGAWMVPDYSTATQEALNAAYDEAWAAIREYVGA